MDNELQLSQYVKVLESSIDGIFSFDRDFRITLWNNQMERFSGLKEELCLGKSAFELFPLLKKHYGLPLQKVFKGRVCILKGMPFNSSLNNGLEEYYEGYYSPIRNEKEEVTGILGIIRELGYRPVLNKNIDEAEEEEEEIPETLLQGLKLEDIFSMDEIHRIQESFSSATGISSVIIDQEGNFISNPSDHEPLCNSLKNKECKRHYSSYWTKPGNIKSPDICKFCGLKQISAPIMIGKSCVAYWIVGQVITEDIKASTDARKHAKSLGISTEEYLHDLKSIPSLTNDRLTKVNELLIVLTKTISTLALKSFQNEKDMSDRKYIANQLINISNRREELARIINKSPAIAFLWKLGQNRPVSFVSENINQFGYNQDDFQSGRIKFSGIIHHEDLDEVEYGLREYLLSLREGSFTKEYRVITKHGGMRWVQERSWPRIDESGRIKYLEGLLVDISVRKFAEEALIASEEQFKLLFERAPIGMALLTTDGELVRVNQAFSEVAGFHSEDFVSFKFTSIVHPDDVYMFVEGDGGMSDQKREYQVENRFVKKNGEILYAITKVALIVDSKGNPHQKLIQIVDITNRKKAENDLISSQNKLHQAQSFAHLGNWELDINTSNIFASEEVYNIYGHQNKTLLNTLDDFLSPITPNHKERVKKSFYDFINGRKKEFNEEYKIVRSDDGKLVAVQTKAEIVVNNHGEPVMALGTIQDITERKIIEEELKTRNDELTNFVYKVSHDLRSPLLSISGLINLLKSSPPEDDKKKYMTLIEGRVKRLDTFIMDILTHSKNLYTDIYIEKIDFQSIINNAFKELSYLENAPKIQTQINVPKKEFYSDRQRLVDIFRNLISNSIQYIHPSKKINFIHIDVSISDRYASIVIEDNGLGIEKSVIPKIFTMFYRGIEISNGSGIGLYIVKQTVEKLGGNISVESVVSEGSKFFVTLPNLVEKKGASVKIL